MTVSSTRPAQATRRTGYVIGALVNLVLLYLVNVWPGWEAVPFLTDATTRVLALVDATMIVGLVVYLGYLVYDSPRAVALGGVLTTGIGLVTMIRFWQVFPFDFGDTAWPVVARILLVVGLVGSVIGLLVQLGRLFRGPSDAG